MYVYIGTTVKNDDQPIKPKTISSEGDKNKIDDQSAFYPTPKPRFDYANPLEESPMSTPRKGSNANSNANPNPSHNPNPLEESPMSTPMKGSNSNVNTNVNHSHNANPNAPSHNTNNVNSFDEQPIKPKTVNYDGEEQPISSPKSKDKSGYVNTFDEQPIKPKKVYRYISRYVCIFM
jgi:hypothetical protein